MHLYTAELLAAHPGAPTYAWQTLYRATEAAAVADAARLLAECSTVGQVLDLEGEPHANAWTDPAAVVVAAQLVRYHALPGQTFPETVDANYHGPTVWPTLDRWGYAVPA